MVDVGDDAPGFTAPLVTEAIAEATLSTHLADGPVVLAFFPGAFSGTCTRELNTFTDRLEAFAARDATVLGVSTDLPWALQRFREREGLSFGLVSDPDGRICRAYGVLTTYDPWDLPGIARRSVFVVDADGTVTYRWLADDPGQEPEYDAVQEAVRAAAAPDTSTD